MCAVIFLPQALWADEKKLILPQSHEEMKQAVWGDLAPCKGCGVVIRVRRVKMGESGQQDNYDASGIEISRNVASGGLNMSYVADSRSKEDEAEEASVE